MLIHLARLYRLYSFALCLAKHLVHTKSIYQKRTMRLFCLYSSCYFGVRKVQLWILLKIVFHWNIQIEMWEWFLPKELHSDDHFSLWGPVHHVHKGLWDLIKALYGMFIGLKQTDVWLGIPSKNIGGRFLARDFVVRTGDGGMGWGGRSGSRQRAGGIQGHCPPVTAKKGFSNVFREIDQTFNCCLVLLWHLCPFGDILWERCYFFLSNSYLD